MEEVWKNFSPAREKVVNIKADSPSIKIVDGKKVLNFCHNQFYHIKLLHYSCKFILYQLEEKLFQT